LVGWLVGWLFGCLVGWLVGWLVGRQAKHEDREVITTDMYFSYLNNSPIY
jgi:NhaP-type Na+/H+ or K+/H+ antiporter